jgi:hypothetical protein
MGSITVSGIEQFAYLGNRFRDAADEGLRKELRQAIERIEPEIKSAIKASALAKLPKRGGYAGIVAGLPVSTRWRFSGDSVGLTISITSHRQLRKVDEGTLRHPLFGNRRHWHTTRVSPGWWSQPVREAGPKARDAIESAMNAVVQRIEGR